MNQTDQREPLSEIPAKPDIKLLPTEEHALLEPPHRIRIARAILIAMTVSLVVFGIVFGLVFFVQKMTSRTTSIHTSIQHTPQTPIVTTNRIAQDPASYHNQEYCIRGYVLEQNGTYLVSSERSPDGATLTGTIVWINRKQQPPKTGYTCGTTDGQQRCWSPRLVMTCGVLRYNIDKGYGPNGAYSFALEDQ